MVISHNHYDHLDHPTIRRLGGEPHYVVPLGLSRWFRRRHCHGVREMDWWQTTEIHGLRITATPAQHWSKRTVLDTNRTLWCSYVIEYGHHKLFFAGDSGYYPGFRSIGEKIPGITIAALPIGAYAPEWFMGDVHMSPEQAVRAYHDLHARHFIAIHHSTFQLTDEPPEEPLHRLADEWKRRHHSPANLWIPRPGECWMSSHCSSK